MKALAILGSLALATYIIVALALTVSSVSKYLFSLSRDGQEDRFWARQGMIFLWPLAATSKEGRHALIIIWTWKDME